MNQLIFAASLALGIIISAIPFVVRKVNSVADSAKSAAMKVVSAASSENESDTVR